jgi:hypothetical protein
MTDPVSPAPSDLLRRFAVAAWGACCGLLIATAGTAALIALTGDTTDRPHPDLLPSAYLKDFEVVPWQERYERIWFTLMCAAGPVCGWAAARYLRISPLLVTPAVIAFVPLAQWACAGVFAAESSIERLLACAGVLAVPAFGSFSAWRGRDACTTPTHPRAAETAAPHGLVTVADSPGSPETMWRTAWLLCLPLALLLVGLLGPYHVPTVASECNTELHVASYLLGPSLYYRAPGTVPGLDFESHYGIGHAYAFSFVVGGGGLQKTLERYVVFLLVVSVLYFLSAMLVFTDWLRSPWAALAVTLALVFTCCEGLAYNMPSCWPIRHPFLFVFLFAAVRGVETGGRGWCVAAGGIAGLSLFWQTDIGLYTLAGGAALYAGAWLFLGNSLWRPVVFLVLGVGSFVALCTLLFGPRVLSVTFAERLLEPLLLYANGFGNQLMNWAPGWGYWYNIIGPGLAIASVGVMIAYGRRGEAIPPRAVLYGAAASLIGLAMLFKWVNRSIDVLWALNGGLVVAVAGWWAWLGWRALAQTLASETRPTLGFARQVAAAVSVIGLVGLGVWQDCAALDPSERGNSPSPFVRAIAWLDHFHNPINAARKGLEPNVRPSPIDEEATAYIHDNTRKTERVVVVSGADWNYLVDAGRAPRLCWAQLYLVHSPVLLERCANDLEHSDRVFVDEVGLYDLMWTNNATFRRVRAILDEHFEIADDATRRGMRWNLYRHKPGPSTGR